VKTEDALMESPEADDDSDEPEPKENGSDAVERRVEKVMSDLREHGLVDENDEKAYDEKKVNRTLVLVFLTTVADMFPGLCRLSYRWTCILPTCELRLTLAITAQL